ncbi:ribonuclease HII [Desmospora activa]|uniref:Ribonuclease HII n=1 Tax=Desmospora activa DSM 45169 TaxID=1121389 RepID=A0A2T4ZB07_9BACL|nr:ribonuclease HII [Desmospora activa]PTM59078.1 RNase HII [Desmospora activa DSM 45169]
MKAAGTIREIEARLKHGGLPAEEIEQLLLDSRAGVRRLALTYQRREERRRQEERRIEEMWQFERTYRQRGCRLIAGLDEAGRGPLAGPVVAAAVILPEDFDATGLNDSKKLTEQERLTLRQRIDRDAVAVAVGVADHRYIDEYNILQATFEAMRRAIAGLTVVPDQLLLDAVQIPGVTIPQEAIVKGDGLSHSIAAASIVAKTERDAWMARESIRYPNYGFEQNMGYGTPDHLVALERWGPTPIHRKSFAPVRERIQAKSGGGR